MKYKNIIKYTVFSSLLFCSLSGRANAIVGLDPGENVTQVVESIGKAVETAEQKVQPVVRKYKSIKTGIKSAIESSEFIQKAKEAYKKTQELKDKAEETMDTVNETKDSTMNAYDEAKGTYDEAKGKVDEAKEAADKAKAMKEQAELSTTLKGLKKDLENTKKEYEEYITVETAKLNAQIQSLTNNNSKLQKMAEEENGDVETASFQIQQNKQKIKELQEQISSIEYSEGAKKLKDRQAEIEEKIAEKEQQIAELTTQLATYGLAAAGMVSGAIQACLDSRGIAWNKFKVNNFLKDGEVIGGQAYDRLKKNYIENAQKDTIEAYLTALEVKNNIASYKEKQKELTDGVLKTESSGSAVLIESSGIRAVNMRMLLDTIKLQIAEMKMETAVDMTNLSIDDISGYSPPEVFTFDDYIFDPNDPDGKKGMLGIELSKNPKDWVDQGKDLYNQGKDAYNEGKEKYEEAKDIAETAKETGEAMKDVGAATSALGSMVTGK